MTIVRPVSSPLRGFTRALPLLGGLLLSGCAEHEDEEHVLHAKTCGPKQKQACPCDAPHELSRAKRVRKDVKDLTATERKRFVEGILKLKQTPSPFDPALSYYDQFVAWHVSLYRCDPTMPDHEMTMGHGGAMFLPWHRVFVLLLEEALREVTGENIPVPYWDWSDPASTAAVFSSDFMGGDGDPNQGYAVVDGPFRKGAWKLNVHPEGVFWQPSASTYLVRHRGVAGPLPSAAEIDAALTRPYYDVPPYDTASDPSQSFRNYIEGWREYPGPSTMTCMPDGTMMINVALSNTMHNAVHMWVGGTVGVTLDGTGLFGTMVMPTSPNDPVFFLHHSNIERLWDEWQTIHGVDTYAPLSGYPHNSADDVMSPFAEECILATPAEVADLSAFGVTYK